MAKNKLTKFAEMETFDNVFQFTVFAVLHTLLCHVKLFPVGWLLLTTIVAVRVVITWLEFFSCHVNV